MNFRSPTEKSRPAGALASPARRANALASSVWIFGVPSSFRPITAYGRTRRLPTPSASWPSSSSRPTSRPGTDIVPYGWPAAVSVSGTAPSHSGLPFAPRDQEVRRRPEPVLVERVPVDRERIVDADRLAGDLLAVLEDAEVGREVASPGPSRCSPGASKS